MTGANATAAAERRRIVNWFIGFQNGCLCICAAEPWKLVGCKTCGTLVISSCSVCETNLEAKKRPVVNTLELETVCSIVGKNGKNQSQS